MHTSKPWSRWYNTRTWKRLRAAQLRKQPLCEESLKMDRLIPATVVDHIKAHKGDWDLFTDPDNLQSLSSTEHSRKTNYVDGGFGLKANKAKLNRGCDVHGIPLDPDHPWRK